MARPDSIGKATCFRNLMVKNSASVLLGGRVGRLIGSGRLRRVAAKCKRPSRGLQLLIPDKNVN